MQAFVRSLHDPFPFARKAGLMGLSATAQSFTVDDISKKILSHISPLLTDKDRHVAQYNNRQVRDQAFSTIDVLLKILRDASLTAVDEVVIRPSIEATKPASATTSVAVPQLNFTTKDKEGWASWALSTAVKTAGDIVIGTASSSGPVTFPNTRLSVTPSQLRSVDASISQSDGPTKPMKSTAAPMSLKPKPATAQAMIPSRSENGKFNDLL